MNKHNAHLYLPLVQALAEGKTLQIKGVIDNSWVDLPNVAFGDRPERYRIKPEPKKVYIIRSCDGAIIDTLNCQRYAAQRVAFHNNTGRRAPYTLEEYVQVD